VRRSFLAPSGSIIPGFSLSLGYTLLYLGVLVLLPLCALALRAAGVGWVGLWHILTDARVIHALWLSFGLAALAAFINVFCGMLVAWVLVRYDFWGRRFFDALVDLPFALPTAVAGIALTALYAPNGWIGQWLTPLGLQIAYTPYGIALALLFVGFPFVVRTVQPLLSEVEKELEEAAASLGAGRRQTVFRVILPPLIPALITGFTLAFARGVGEYGSVIFIAGNMPYVSEIAPLLIFVRLEEFDYAGATAIATVMLGLSFIILFLLNGVQALLRRRYGG
jgi:sulfate/thiosulfate transport system permease protein